MQIPARVPSIIAFKIILIVSIVIACHYPFFEWAVSDFTAGVVVVTHGLAQEVIICVCCKIVFGSGFTTKRFSITNLLKIVKPTGDAFVSIRVVGIEVVGSSAINSGIYFGTFQDRKSVV